MTADRSSCRPRSPPTGTTWPPTCRNPSPPALHPGTREPLGPRRPGAAVPDGADHAGGQHRALGRDPRARSATSTGCGGRRR